MARPVTKKISSLREMRVFARSFAKKIASGKKHSAAHAAVLALSGDLGSGKTTFTQDFLRALGVRKKIQSPTFVLIKKYKISGGARFVFCDFRFAYHLDCYRIKEKDLTRLGLKEILADAKNIVLIEWAERVKKNLPKESLRLKFSHGESENIRVVRIRL